MNALRRLVCAIALLTAVHGDAYARDATWTIAPYARLPPPRGEVGIAGQSVPIDAGIKDLAVR